MRNRLLHLVTRKAARNENAAEKLIWIDFPYTCKPRQRMHIKSVASVHDGDGFAARHSLSCHLKRDMEYGSVAVEQEDFAGLFRKRADDAAGVSWSGVEMF